MNDPLPRLLEATAGFVETGLAKLDPRAQAGLVDLLQQGGRLRLVVDLAPAFQVIAVLVDQAGAEHELFRSTLEAGPPDQRGLN